MSQVPTANRHTWHVGQRVARKDSADLGTVIEIAIDGGIKVKWDSAQTSYYRHGQQANVQLEPVKTN